MSLKVKDFMNFMENKAPISLKEDFDNVGLMVGDNNQDIKNILVALDCTLEVIDEAMAKSANLIFTHHPLIFRKPSNITTETLQGSKIIKLIKNDISLYSAHTNLDSAKCGINDIALNILGFSKGEIIEKSKVKLDECGIGRIVTLKEAIKFDGFCNEIKAKLNLNSLKIVGDLNKNIKKIAIINGSGQDFFQKAYNMGADLVITGDTTYHYASDYNEMGMCIIDVGHFILEWMALEKFAKNIESFIEENNSNVRVYISEKSKDPYGYI